MTTIYSYSNDNAIEDGEFADVTPDSMKQKGFQWIVTSSVYAEFSLAAFAELFNEMVAYYNRTKDTLTESKMNGKKLFLMFEEEAGKKIFKICFPSEY